MHNKIDPPALDCHDEICGELILELAEIALAGSTQDNKVETSQGEGVSEPQVASAVGRGVVVHRWERWGPEA